MNIILVDAEHLDRVTFNLIVNFERMLERRIPPADLARWVDCIALDGGLRAGDNETQVFFVHNRATKQLQHFVPNDLATDIDGKAFKDNLGEFQLKACPAVDIATKADLFINAMHDLLAKADTERMMVVADMAEYGARVKATAQAAEGKDITLFDMEPVSGRGFQQEILGYSLMSALGISSDEF